jgi:hypothetical protein
MVMVIFPFPIISDESSGKRGSGAKGGVWIGEVKAEALPTRALDSFN